jgi:hypothetical protein
MWAVILSKPLQGMAFQTIRAQLINCSIKYEDANNEQTKQITKKPVVAKQSVTWNRTK